MRYTRDGVLDAGFGSAGTVQTPVGKRAGISALFWDAEGRLLAAGTSDGSGVLLRYSGEGALDGTEADLLDWLSKAWNIKIEIADGAV